MFSRVKSALIVGVEIAIVSVETDIRNGLPAFDMVGLLSSEVKEARERVRTSIKNSGINWEPKHITVNLAPAGLRKEGGSFDLAVAVGILLAMGTVNSIINIEETLFVGELGLDGCIYPVRGVLAIVAEGKKQGIKNFFVPRQNAAEGAVISDVSVIGIGSLRELIEALNGEKEVQKETCSIQELYDAEEEKNSYDFSMIRGQAHVKKAAEIAAAGRHHMLMIGPPGSGKSLVARCIPSILPKPDLEECIEITKIQSIAGRLQGRILIKERPFCSPHHSATTKALIGGGMHVTPGEVTVAHRGVLFLDELTEFRRETLDALRQPLEDGKIVLSRIYGTYVFPADLMLIAAANPCLCGYYPNRKKCRCSEYGIKRYLGRLSGPFVDRMDLCVSVSEVKSEDLQGYQKEESSASIRKRVEYAMHCQKERFAGSNIRYNAQMTPEMIKKYCYLGEREKRLLNLAFEKFSMSARMYHKTIKVARTIADLDGSIQIKEAHIGEAIGYRMQL